MEVLIVFGIIIVVYVFSIIYIDKQYALDMMRIERDHWKKMYEISERFRK